MKEKRKKGEKGGEREEKRGGVKEGKYEEKWGKLRKNGKNKVFYNFFFQNAFKFPYFPPILT